MRQFTSPDFLKAISSYRVMFIPAFIILLFTTGCEKEKVVTTNIPPPAIQPPTPPPTPPPITNTAPRANAGQTKYVAFPADSIFLKGSAYDKENNVASYVWKKVSGPESFNIENPAYLETKVRNLKVGEYAFELTVIDSLGLQGRDTVKVFVLHVGQNEVTFKDLTWSCPMGCTVVVNNFTSFVPQGTAVLVFLREKNSTTWLPVIKEEHWTGTEKYVYGVYNDSDTFWIYSNDEEGKLDVKIQF
jgi:hypothetical protein